MRSLAMRAVGCGASRRLYPELSFIEMVEVVQRLPMVIEKDNDAPRMACSYCGVFRRQGINHPAQRLGADVIAWAHPTTWRSVDEHGQRRH